PLATGRAPGAGEVCSGFFENMGSRLQEGARIDRAIVDAHLEVEVRAGRAAGAADRADHLAGSDALADARAPRRHMRVAGHHAVAVADLDDLAVPRLGADERDLAVGGGVDRRARAAAKIEAG